MSGGVTVTLVLAMLPRAAPHPAAARACGQDAEPGFPVPRTGGSGARPAQKRCQLQTQSRGRMSEEAHFGNEKRHLLGSM